MDPPANGAVDPSCRAPLHCDRSPAGNRRCGESDANARCDHVHEKSKRRTSVEDAAAYSSRLPLPPSRFRYGFLGLTRIKCGANIFA
jgi:hypothetical protein